MPGYVEGQPPKSQDQSVDKDNESQTHLSTHGVSKIKTVDSIHDKTKESRNESSKTKEVGSCSKQMSDKELTERPANALEQILPTKSSHCLSRSKSCVHMLKSPSQDIKDNDIKSNVSSVVYSNSEFSIPSALKVGLDQYSFLDKYSYSYLDAYISTVETRQSDNQAIGQLETKKPRVQIYIHSETELIKEPNMDFQDNRSSSTLLPKHQDSRNPGVEEEIWEKQKTKALEIKDVEDIKPVEEQDRVNQTDGQPSTIMLYSQASVAVQTIDRPSSEQLQTSEESKMIAVARQNRQFTPSDYPSGQLLHSPVVDINPIVLDTGQTQLGTRTSPLKFNQIRQKEQSNKQTTQETRQESFQRLEVQESTEPSTPEKQKTVNSPRTSVADSSRKTSEHLNQTSAEATHKSTPNETPERLIQPNQPLSSTQSHLKSALKRESILKHTDDVLGQQKTRDDQKSDPETPHQMPRKPALRSESLITEALLTPRGIRIRDDDSLPEVQQRSGGFEIETKGSICQPEKIVSILKRESKQSKCDLIRESHSQYGHQLTLKDLAKPDSNTGSKLRKSDQKHLAPNQGPAEAPAEVPIQRQDPDKKGPGYMPQYAPVQQRSGMGTGAAVGLGVGALAAGGLAGYALGGGFSSDSPPEQVQVVDDFAGDGDWME